MTEIGLVVAWMVIICICFVISDLREQINKLKG